MSNALVITVTEFRSLGDDKPTFGFTAADDYSSIYENHYTSIREFKEQFPDKDELILHVLGNQAFEGAARIEDNGRYTLDSCSGVFVIGYDDIFIP